MSLRKSILGTASWLGLSGALAVGGCIGDRDTVPSAVTALGRPEVGKIDLSLILPDGSDVGDPTYTITRPSVPEFQPVTGTLAIGSGGVASASITGLPVGTGFHAEITAARTSPAGAPACTGGADFEVLASGSTVVNVTLNCDDTSTDTTLTINGTLNMCPKIGSTSYTPSTAAVGSAIALSATVTDADSDPLTYRWLADGAEIATTAAASYTCAVAGEHTINLTVTDGPARGCSKSLPMTIVVTCTAAADAGPGVEDAASPVDTGVEDATPPGDDAASDAAPPAEDAGADAAADAGSDADPAWPLGSAECVQCQRDNCTAYSLDAIDTLAGCSDSLCRALVACTLETDCFTSTADIPRCFCGDVTTDACLQPAHVLAGPCLSLTQQGLDTTDKQAIFERTVNPAYAAGRGYQHVTCIADLCQAACL